jgi:hypothetical protein
MRSGSLPNISDAAPAAPTFCGLLELAQYRRLPRCIAEQSRDCDAKSKLQVQFGSFMSGIVPGRPSLPTSGSASPTVCELVLPRSTPWRAELFKLCKALPRGMPDKLEVSLIRYDHGVERSTAAYYDGRAYLIHIAMLPAGRR